jgi:ribosome biogenesis protein Nip4
MRPLTEDESKAVFEKLANYIVRRQPLIHWMALYRSGQGKNLVHLIDRPDEPYCFRLQKDRVYYVSESSMRLGVSVARTNLISLGTCFGKFSKSGKFKLHITSLDYLAQYAKYKVRCSYLKARVVPIICAGVDKTEWGNVFFVWQPCPQKPPRTNNRRHT